MRRVWPGAPGRGATPGPDRGRRSRAAGRRPLAHGRRRRPGSRCTRCRAHAGQGRLCRSRSRRARASPEDVAEVGVTVYRLQLGVEPVDGDADGVQHLVEQSPLGRFQVQSRDQCAVLLDRREVVQRSGVDVAEEAVDLSERTTTAYGVECSRRVVVDVLPQRHEHAVLLVGAGVDRPRRGNDLPAGPVEEGRDHELPLGALGRPCRHPVRRVRRAALGRDAPPSSERPTAPWAHATEVRSCGRPPPRRRWLLPPWRSSICTARPGWNCPRAASASWRLPVAVPDDLSVAGHPVTGMTSMSALSPSAACA